MSKRYYFMVLVLFIIVEILTSPVFAQEVNHYEEAGLRGQCTWYAANMRTDLRFNRGNAATWAATSRNHNPSYVVDNTPEVGSIAVWGSWVGGAFQNGHVAYVTAVADSTHFTVSECNWPIGTCYTTRRVTWVTGIQFIHPLNRSSTTNTPQTTPDPQMAYTALFSPASANVGSIVAISVSAVDTAGHRSVQSIQVQNGSQTIGTVQGSSGTVNWNTSGLNAGNVTISFTARLGGWTGTVPNRSVSYQLTNTSSTSSSGSVSIGACSVSVIENYLRGTALEGLAGEFVNRGNQYNVDPRFLIAIANAESSLGRNLCGAYNAWGEMRSGGGCYTFGSWSEGIEFVAQHIGNHYLPQGQNSIAAFVTTQYGGTCTSHCYCASGCQNWIANVGAALSAMGANPNATDLTYHGCSGSTSQPPITTTDNPPNRPTAQSPYDWWTTTNPQVQLCAQSNGDPDSGDQVTAYFFEIYESAQNWQSGWVTSNCATTTSLDIFNYQWHVRVRDNDGTESAWSDARHFSVLAASQSSQPSQTQNSAPSAPTLRDPANGSSLPQSTDIWYSWNNSSDAQAYFLEYWGGPYSTLNSGWISDTAHHIGTMWPGTYSWHVRARNSSGESSWSSTWTFTIQDSNSNPAVVNTSAATPIPPTQASVQFTGNVAPRAGRSPDGINSGYAFDGDPNSYWVNGLGHAFTLSLNWGDALPVTRIVVWDRPQSSEENNQINTLRITLSNGMSRTFGMDSGGRRCIDISLSSPQVISSITLVAEDASGNNGLGEVEIWVGPKTGGPSCSNTGSMP